MTAIDTHVFGDRWAVAERAAKPAWVQIEERLADRIECGLLAFDERLPAERDIAESLNVSRMTVRQALASLAARGLVARTVGRGTFVLGPQVVHDLTRVAGFTEAVERQGLEASARIIDAGCHPAPSHVAKMLEIAPGADVVRLERVRLAGAEPLTLEDTWLPAELFPGLLGRDLGGSLYDLMRDQYDLGPVSATESLEPVAARADEASSLGVPEGSPLMLVVRVAFAADGRPVEYARDRHRGDRARFTLSIVPDTLLARAR